MVDTLVQAGDPVSEKIIKHASKYNALDECMAAVKKGFEKGVIDIEDFLATIRKLSGKQAKQIAKMRKLEAYLNPEENKQPMGQQ